MRRVHMRKVHDTRTSRGASALATARKLLDSGAARVVLVDRPDSEGAARAAELGDRAAFAAADVLSCRRRPTPSAWSLPTGRRRSQALRTRSPAESWSRLTDLPSAKAVEARRRRGDTAWTTRYRPPGVQITPESGRLARAGSGRTWLSSAHWPFSEPPTVWDAGTLGSPAVALWRDRPRASSAGRSASGPPYPAADPSTTTK